GSIAPMSTSSPLSDSMNKISSATSSDDKIPWSRIGVSSFSSRDAAILARVRIQLLSCVRTSISVMSELRCLDENSRLQQVIHLIGGDALSALGANGMPHRAGADLIGVGQTRVFVHRRVVEIAPRRAQICAEPSAQPVQNFIGPFFPIFLEHLVAAAASE